MTSAFDDIPPLSTPQNQPPIGTHLDLFRFWRSIMGPLGFGRRTLWIALTDADGRVSPVIQQVEDVPRRAGRADAAPLIEMLGHLRPYFTGGAVALCYTRPGVGPMNADDRSWARALTAVAAQQGVPLWPVHFANDLDLLPYAPDDLTLNVERGGRAGG